MNPNYEKALARGCAEQLYSRGCALWAELLGAYRARDLARQNAAIDHLLRHLTEWQAYLANSTTTHP